MTARQVAEIEKKSPQIRNRSDELWKLFIGRDFPDRPIPDSYYRRTYSKYYKEKEAHLKNASTRLRQSLEKFKEEKASRTITALEVDPRASRATARRKASSAAPSGSRLIQKAIQSARTKGPLFSPRNTQFAKIGNMNVPTSIRAPRGIPLPKMANSSSSSSTVSLDKKRSIGSVDDFKAGTNSIQNDSIDSHKKIRITPAAADSVTKPLVAQRKKPTSSVFLQRRK